MKRADKKAGWWWWSGGLGVEGRQRGEEEGR